MKYGAQTDVFRMIPGFENARFARLGGIHRNTFLNSPRLLDAEMRLKSQPNIRFAGQITGVEGYVESAAMGLLAGRFAAKEAILKALGTGWRAGIAWTDAEVLRALDRDGDADAAAQRAQSIRATGL